MSNPEVLNFMAKLKGLFPQAELTKDEAELWAKRLRRVEYQAAVTALEDHKIEQDGRNRRRPSLGTVLKGVSKATANVHAPPPPSSLINVLRSKHPDLKDSSDFELSLRYWRCNWHKYSVPAAERRGAIVRALERRGVPREVRANLLRDHDRQVVSFRRKVRRSCFACLSAAGMLPDVARRYARAVVKSDPEMFRRVLEDVRDFGAAVSTAAA